jgi:hypothetical protein
MKVEKVGGMALLDILDGKVEIVVRVVLHQGHKMTVMVTVMDTKVLEVVGVMGVFQPHDLCGDSVVRVVRQFVVVLGVVQTTPDFSIVWRVTLMLFPNP